MKKINKYFSISDGADIVLQKENLCFLLTGEAHAIAFGASIFAQGAGTIARAASAGTHAYASNATSIAYADTAKSCAYAIVAGSTAIAAVDGATAFACCALGKAEATSSKAEVVQYAQIAKKN